MLNKLRLSRHLKFSLTAVGLVLKILWHIIIIIIICNEAEIENEQYEIFSTFQCVHRLWYTRL